MTIVDHPSKVEDSLGQVKANSGSYTNPSVQTNATQFEELKTRLIEVHEEVGKSDGSEAGSINARVKDLEDAGSGPLDLEVATATDTAITITSVDGLAGPLEVKPYGLSGVTDLAIQPTIVPSGTGKGTTVTAGQGATGSAGGTLSLDAGAPNGAGAGGNVRIGRDNAEAIFSGLEGVGSVWTHEGTIDATGLSIGGVPVGGGGGGVPSTRVITAGAGLTGGGDLSADRSFAVDIASTAPPALGTPAAGSSGKVSDRDHVHAHGSQTDPTHHALVTDTTHGFLDSQGYDLHVGDSKRRRLLWRTDMGRPLASDLLTLLSGAGAGVSQTATGAGSIVLVGSGATSTGYGAIRSVTNYLYSAAIYISEAYMSVVGGMYDGLSNGTDDYITRVCLFADSALNTSRVCLTYDYTVSANWQLEVRVAGVSSYVDTGVPVVVAAGSVNLYNRFEVHITGGTTGTATAWIDGVQVAQVVGGLPAVGAGYYVPAMVVKTVGTSTRRFAVDYTEGWDSPVGGVRA